jgi:hypothetical protein
MKQVDLGWAAGFIDGEGFIGTAACTHKGVARVQLQALMDVSQVKPAPLYRLQSLFGGRVRPQPGPMGITYFWRLYGAKAVAVLLQVRSQLSAKGEQADLVIEFQATKFANRKGNPNGQISDAVYARRMEIHDQLRVLNARRVRHAERLSEEAPQANPLRVVR